MRPSHKRTARVGRPSSAVGEARAVGRPTGRARSASLGGFAVELSCGTSTDLWQRSIAILQSARGETVGDEGPDGGVEISRSRSAPPPGHSAHASQAVVGVCVGMRAWAAELHNAEV
eukprot:4355319-Prymnesium_polylepis.1